MHENDHAFIWKFSNYLKLRNGSNLYFIWKRIFRWTFDLVMWLLIRRYRRHECNFTSNSREKTRWVLFQLQTCHHGLVHGPNTLICELFVWCSSFFGMESILSINTLDNNFSICIFIDDKNKILMKKKNCDVLRRRKTRRKFKKIFK